MTTPGKAKLLADESARDLDAGLDKVHAETAARAGEQDEAHEERAPERDHDSAGTDETQRRY